MNRWELLACAGTFVSTFVAVFLPLALVFAGSKEWKAAQERARERCIADARMNARLLRFNI